MIMFENEKTFILICPVIMLRKLMIEKLNKTFTPDDIRLAFCTKPNDKSIDLTVLDNILKDTTCGVCIEVLNATKELINNGVLVDGFTLTDYKGELL